MRVMTAKTVERSTCVDMRMCKWIQTVVYEYGAETRI